MILSICNGFVPVFHRQPMRRSASWKMKPITIRKMVGMDNKRPLRFTKATGLPPADHHLLDPDDPLFDYKTLSKEIVASTSFAEVVCFYPSGELAIKAALTYAGMFQTFSHGKFQPTNCISLSKNIFDTGFPPMDIGDAIQLVSQGKVSIVFIQPIQRLGDKYTFTKDQLQSLRDACDKAGVLLAFDEMNCGLGQTGRLWAHEEYGVKPDLMMVHYPRWKWALLLNKRMNAHICKFEDDYIPEYCGEALRFFRIYARPDVLDIIRKKGQFLKEIISKELEGKAHVRDIKVLGLLVEVELDVEVQPVVDFCKEHAARILVGGEGNILSFRLPLTSSVYDLDMGVRMLTECMKVLD